MPTAQVSKQNSRQPTADYVQFVDKVAKELLHTGVHLTAHPTRPRAARVKKT